MLSPLWPPTGQMLLWAGVVAGTMPTIGRPRAEGTRERVLTLHGEGWTGGRIGRHLGINPGVANQWIKEMHLAQVVEPQLTPEMEAAEDLRFQARHILIPLDEWRTQQHELAWMRVGSAMQGIVESPLAGL